ncbi:MAG: hypothetical protein KAJ63_16605, partial [Methyloprofundus sp.]|nr:hypothetical protein [Methyloprofundus sp.]
MKGYLGFVLFFIVIFLDFSTISAKPLTNEAKKGAVVKNKHMSVLTDKDGDQLSDGLQARMAGMAASDIIDVIVTFRGARKNQSHVV